MLQWIVDGELGAARGERNSRRRGGAERNWHTEEGKGRETQVVRATDAPWTYSAAVGLTVRP
jgi:hypothetical protein